MVVSSPLHTLNKSRTGHVGSRRLLNDTAGIKLTKEDDVS